MIHKRNEKSLEQDKENKDTANYITHRAFNLSLWEPQIYVECQLCFTVHWNPSKEKAYNKTLKMNVIRMVNTK